MEARARPADAPPLDTLRQRVERGGRGRWYRRVGDAKKGFRYEDADGKRVTNAATLERIRKLRIPPAWQPVRIAPSPRQRLQAIGVDAAGRVQYLYNAAFRARREREKYSKMERFGAALPALRRATNAHLAAQGFPRERVLALVVRLIHDLCFRVGSEKSVARYRTYGVTTLRNRHLTISRGGRCTFCYRGKHHVPLRPRSATSPRPCAASPSASGTPPRCAARATSTRS